VSASALPDGVYTVVPTPFDERGALDLASLERLVEFLVELGVDGLLVLGVMGEALKLLAAERSAVVETAIAAAGGRCPVIVGATHASVEGTRAHARAAEAAGAAAVLVAPPSLDRAAGDDVLVSYFAAAGAGLGIEVVLQDHPASSGVTLPPRLVARIAEAVPEVRSVKLEDPPTPPKVTRLRELAPAVKVFGGLGGVFFLEELERGAGGTMTGFAFPELLLEVWRAHADGDRGRAEDTFFRALPLIRFEFQEAIGLAIRKRTYQLRGAIASDHVRPPAAPVDAATLETLERLIARAGVGAPSIAGPRGAP
jgi:4-hydroxy-tetrahydrodipicolinate synthase